jgi:hypothetical protein
MFTKQKVHMPLKKKLTTEERRLGKKMAKRKERRLKAEKLKRQHKLTMSEAKSLDTDPRMTIAFLLNQ